MQLTNTHEAFKFVAFLEEGLNYTDALTPTMINSGGCGVFAQILSDKLTSLGIEHQIIGMFSKDRWGVERDIENNFLHFLKTNKVKGNTAAQHICIQIDELYLDSTGLCNQDVTNNKDLFVMTREQLDVLVEDGNWNPLFDRGCIPFIKGKIDEVFSQMDNFHSGMFKTPKDGIQYSDYTIKQRRKMEPDSFMNNLQQLLR